MTYPNIKFELNVCNPYRDNEQKLKFLKKIFFKRDNSVKNQQTMTKFELDLRSPMTYPYWYIKFELNVCNPYRDNERKLKFLIFFFQEG